MKVAFVTSLPTPYQDPLLNVVAGHPNVELDVYYCAPKRADRPWELNWEMNYNAIYLPSVNFAKPLSPDASCYWNRGFLNRFRKGDYDALIVCGYNHITMLAAIAYARFAGIPYILSSEVYLAQPRSKWRLVVKDRLVRWIVRNAAGCFPTGTLSSEYLLHYGADRDRLARIPNAPDVDYFARTATALRAKKHELRSELGLGDEKVILFVSRLIQLKRVDVLLRAFARIRDAQPAKLIILGDGDMRETWQRLATELNLNDAVDFRGFIAPADLPRWYAIADLFVLPSEDETWSVVVLEALASGVPVVITEMVGCHPDMINSSRIGAVVPADDVDSMAEAIRDKLNDHPSPEEVSTIWAPIRESVRYPNVANTFVHALEKFAV